MWPVELNRHLNSIFKKIFKTNYLVYEIKHKKHFYRGNKEFKFEIGYLLKKEFDLYLLKIVLKGNFERVFKARTKYIEEGNTKAMFKRVNSLF